jgi:hypothetical protein
MRAHVLGLTPVALAHSPLVAPAQPPAGHDAAATRYPSQPPFGTRLARDVEFPLPAESEKQQSQYARAARSPGCARASPCAAWLIHGADCRRSFEPKLTKDGRPCNRCGGKAKTVYAANIAS